MNDRDDALEHLFAAARHPEPVPSQVLMHRILTDAVAVQAQHGAQAPARRAARPRRLGWVDRVAAVFGGGGALAGMSLAMVAGVFIGIAQPNAVAALTSGLLADAALDSVDLLPGDDPLWGE